MVMSAGPFAQPPEVTHLGPEPRGEIGHNALNYLFEVALGGATWLNEFHRFNKPHIVKVGKGDSLFIPTFEPLKKRTYVRSDF